MDMGKAIILKKKDGEKVYPISASDLIFDPVTKKHVKQELAEKIGDAPSDGKQYVRINNGWAEAEGGSFNFLQVNIESNQDGDTTIKLVKATVTYGSESVEVSNGEFISLPENTNVTISFPEVSGYKKPEDITFAYTNGPASKSGIYLTELVVVNLSAFDKSSVRGQIVTINGEAFTYGSYPVEKKIPFGTEYSVSVDYKDGFLTPESETFIASKSVRELEMVYKEIQYGVYIQGISRRLYTPNEWSNQETANGVAVVTDKCEFVIALSNGPSKMQINSYNELSLETYLTAIYDETSAKSDYDGAKNTSNIMKQQSSTDYAAGWCSAFSFPSGKKGFLPSFGQMWAAHENITAINDALTKAGGNEIENGYFWTSTFWGKDGSTRKFWVLHVKGGIIDSAQLLANSYSTRAFTTLN